MKKIININEWNRKELFNHYDSLTNPFVFVNTSIDITNIYNYCKKTHKSMYATIGYLITMTVNKIEEFKYRKVDNKIIVHDQIKGNFTENIDGKKIGFFTLDYTEDYDKFINSFYSEREELIHPTKERPEINYDSDEVWMSCAPWFVMNSVLPPFTKENTIPQFIWDKFIIKDSKVTINLMIMAHHGFVDGFHLGECINLLQESINNFNK